MTRRIAQAAHGLTADRVMMILMNFKRIQLTKLCGVSLDTVNDWFAGREPVPFVVLEFLRFLSGRLPPAFGELGGWYFADGRLVPPDCTWRDGIAIELIKKARYLAVADRQLNRALDQIKRLEKERDFYKRNCHRQARFGMMVNALFGWD